MTSFCCHSLNSEMLISFPDFLFGCAHITASVECILIDQSLNVIRSVIRTNLYQFCVLSVKRTILGCMCIYHPILHFQYTHFTSCHPPSMKNGFVKGEALRILRTNSSKDTFEENISQFKRHLRDRGYPRNLVEKLLSEINFTRRYSVLKGKNKTQKDILLFVTQYRPTVSNLKQALLTKWHLIQNQPLLRQIFKEPPIISYKKGKSLRDLLVRAKL